MEQMGILPTIAKRQLAPYLGFTHTLVAPEHSTANLMNKVTCFFLLVLINGCHSIKQLDIEGIKGTKIATSENQIVTESIVQNVRLSESSKV